MFVGLAYLNPSKDRVCQFSLMFLAVVISGFRNHLSGDFGSYIGWYNNKSRDNDIEYGFLILMNWFREFNLSYHFFFFFFSFWTVFFVFFGIRKYTTHSSLAFLFFLLIPALFLNSWSIIRQAFAMSIAFYAFYYLINKKYLIYFLLMSIGISIHYSAIIPFFLFIFVYKFADKIRIIHIVILLLLSFILSQFYWVGFFLQFFDKTHYSYYFSNAQQQVNPYKVIVLNGLGLFLLFYFEKMKKAYPIQKYFMILCFFSIITTNIFAKANDLNRFSYYFTIFEVVVFADLVFLEFKKKRLMLFMGTYLYAVSLFLYTIKADYNLNNQNTKYIPYNCIFYKFDDPFFMIGTNYLVDPSIDKKVK